MTPARPSPIERFLGRAEAAGGPFALLGLHPDAVSDELVLAALDRQIERVSAHPERDTPEADEVRLALHAVAAQLLDPVVRRHLVARWGGTDAPAEPARTPARALEHDAILALALFGGWNRRSMRRLVSVAHQRGLPTAEVARTLRGMARRRRADVPRGTSTNVRAPVVDGAGVGGAPGARAESVAPVRAPAASAGAPEPLGRSPEFGLPTDDPGQRLLRRALLVGAGSILGLGVVVTAIIVATRPPAAPVVVGPAAGAAGSIAAGNGPARGRSVGDRTPGEGARERGGMKGAEAPSGARGAASGARAERTEATVLADLPRAIGRASEGLATDPEHAGAEFERLATLLSREWPGLARDGLAASNDAVIDYLYHAGSAGRGVESAVGLLAAWSGWLAPSASLTDDRLAPAVWSAAMLHRVLRERDLPAQARSIAESALRDLDDRGRSPSDASFEASVVAVLSAVPGRLARPGGGADVDAKAWSRWATIVDAVSLHSPRVRSPLMLAGLEALLAEGPEPNASPGASEAIGLLIGRQTWRAGDDGRRWVLRWFGDRRISVADLNAVTSALATRSSAEGVDVTMVLSTSASEAARAALRDRYARAWGAGDEVARGAVAADLIARAEEVIEASRSATDDAGQLAATARLARLHDAFSWLWRGDGSEAAAILASLSTPIDQAATPGRMEGQAIRLSLTEGAWAEQYLGLRQNPKQRLDKLASANFGPGDIGATDAEVIAGEAIFGTPVEVRTKAAEIVRQFRLSPAMINAVLERLPRIPPGSAAGRAVIESVVQRQLPGAKDPTWGLVARRLLVQSLLEAMAAESPRAAIDRLAVVLAISYRSIGSPVPLTTDQRLSPSQPRAAEAAGSAWARVRPSADLVAPTGTIALSLRAIDQRRAGRLSQARGPVQEFGAEQVSLAELMGYVVGSERPAQAERAAQIVEELIRERRSAGTIFEQLLATERAMVHLWVLRLKEEAS
ncbi:MAG: hypothetical protein JNM80_04055 [Phycisphaerae bacterium]|nr:hypothetical protein [Phycisphaerae bacterium]